MTIEFDQIIDGLTPDIQVETDWTSGSTGLPNDKKTLLLMGQVLAAGSVGVPTGSDVQTPSRITGVQKAISLFGKGSNLAIMCEYAIKAAPRATIYAVAIKAGNAPVVAEGIITLATNASSSGELRVHICGERFVVGIANAATPTEVGDAMVAAINAHPNLPVTAANVVGVMTLTNRIAGLPGNSVAYRSEITCTGMTTTDTAARCTAGAVACDPTTQLASMLATRYHLICLEGSDATSQGLIQAHQETASTPSQKRWGLGICASVGDASAGQTLGNALDSYRMQCVWQENGDRTEYAIAAAFAGMRAQKGPKTSFDDVEVPGLQAQYDEDAWPNAGDIETALEEGLVVLRPVRSSGGAQVVRSVVTRQTVPISYRDHMIPEKSDYTDLAVINGLAVYKGKTLKSASPPGTPSTITPGRAKAKVARVLKALDKLDILQGVDAAIQAGNVQAAVNATVATRIDCAYPFFPTQTAHQIMCKKTYQTTSAV